MARLVRISEKFKAGRGTGKMNNTMITVRRALMLLVLAFLIFHDNSAPRSFAASYDAAW